MFYADTLKQKVVKKLFIFIKTKLNKKKKQVTIDINLILFLFLSSNQVVRKFSNVFDLHKGKNI